jgi:trimethylamine--corrinoid protein Co-methyltransferase
VDVGYAQVGKHLGLPTHAYMGLADTKGVDYQSGLESGLGAVLAALAGINVVSGAGMLDFESCQSLEKLVLDNEACGMALRLVRGVSHASAAEAVELLRQLVETGSLLGHRHTRANFRAELLIPGPVIDRASYGDWEKSGSRDSRAAAADEVRRVIARGNKAPVSDEMRRELDGLIRAEGRRLGIERLPGV